MINLIPNQEKKRKVKDFYFRLTVVSFVVFGCCLLVSFVAMLPSYFLSTVKKNLSETKLELQKNESIPLNDQNTLATVADLNTKLNIVENAEKNKYPISVKVINEIMLHKTANIKITEISYDNTTAAGKKISIRGIAPSRDQLLKFSRALQEDTAFKKVDLPISNFVKGSNIQFFLTLIPN